MKQLIILIALFLSACSTAKLPQPSGPEFPININKVTHNYDQAR